MKKLTLVCLHLLRSSIIASVSFKCKQSISTRMEFDEFDDKELRDRVKEFIALCTYVPDAEYDKISELTKQSGIDKCRLDDSQHESDLQEWFNEMKEKIDCLGSLKNVPWNTGINQHMFYLLRQCVITNRWVKTAQLLPPLSVEHIDNISTVWKLSMEVMMKDPENYQTVVDKLVRKIIGCKIHVNQHEVVLDYLIYLLSQGRFNEVHDLPQVKVKNRVFITDRIKEIKTLYSAFTGLVWYHEWLRLKDNYNKQTTELPAMSALSQIQSSSGIRVKMETLCDRMENSWKELASKNGVWDIFLYKLVEVYEGHDKYQEAENILIKYLETNERNISIYHQLYQFYQRNNSSTSNIIDTLKQILKLDPSTVRVFDLYKLMMESESPDIDYLSSTLFHVMDYHPYHNSLQGWTTLATHIVHVLSSPNKKHQDQIRNLWESKQAIWCGYHFNKNSVDPRWTPQNVLEQKVICRILFDELNTEDSEDDGYVSAGKEYLTREQWVKIKTVIKSFQVIDTT